jgi:molybdopterin converting factor small subunit
VADVLLFGKLRDAFGAERIGFPEGAATAADLRTRLAGAYPDAAGLILSKSVRIAVNQVLVADEAGTRVSPADEVALLPPLSGG